MKYKDKKLESDLNGRPFESFNIGGLNIAYAPKGELLNHRIHKYRVEPFENADIVLNFDEEWLKNNTESVLPMDLRRYNWASAYFAQWAVIHSGFVLHASAVVYKGNAYLFSALSGTGKSTHTHLWINNFEGSFILNDDKPLIREIEGKFYACGTPFSGKSDENENMTVPLRALVWLKRGEQNQIREVDADYAMKYFFSEIMRMRNPKLMKKQLALVSRVMDKVRMFELCCNMDNSAAKTAYNGIEEIYRLKGEK